MSPGYTAQAEDTLPRLADKYYRDPLLWPAIWFKTNEAAENDAHFTMIEGPAVVSPGQQLAIPPLREARQLATGYHNAARSPILVPPPEVQALTPSWLTGFAAYVDDARQHFEIPGAALAIVHNDQIALAQGFGVQQVGVDEPVSPETVFGIGSTTKAMTSLMIATLVDDGILAWDQPVIEIWPDLRLSDPAVARQLRVRDLLNMSSGVPRKDLAWSGIGLTAEETMASLVDLPVEALPGDKYQYNNQLVATGGYVAALAAGAPFGKLEQGYADLMQSRVFDPIGMPSATLSIKAAQSSPNHATPHDFTLTGEVIPTHYHADPGIAPAGAVNTNILDLARFLLVQLNRGVNQTGARVVSEQNLAETWQPQIEIVPDFSYGMGWFIEEYHDVEIIWHDGDVLGFKSLMVFVPEANAGLVLLSNRTISFGFANSVRYHFVEALYGLDVEAGEEYKKQWDTFVEEALPQIRESLAVVISPEEASSYIGQYETGWQVEHRDNGTLWAKRGPYQWQLLKAEAGRFIINNGFGITSEVLFSTDEAGVGLMEVKLSNGETGQFRALEQ